MKYQPKPIIISRLTASAAICAQTGPPSNRRASARRCSSSSTVVNRLMGAAGAIRGNSSCASAPFEMSPESVI